MKRVLTVIAIVVLSIPVATSQDSAAPPEESKSTTAAPSSTTRVYQLEYVDVGDVTRLIETVMSPQNSLHVASDPRTNSLYVQAGPEEQKWLDAIISNIDVSAEKRRSPATTGQLQLKHVDAQEALRVIDSLGLISQNLTVAVAPNSNSLLARGSSECIAELDRLIQQIDTPPETFPGVNQAASKDLEKSVVVTLNRAGQAIIAGRVTTVAQLESMLGPESSVEIYVDDDVNYEKVAQLIDRLKALRVKRVGVRIKHEKNAATGFNTRLSMRESDRSAAKVLRDAYESAERAAAKSAQLWREEKQKKSPNTKILTDLRSKLADSVQAAFRLRQQWQREQLELHRLELSRLNERLERRETIARQIIDHRVRELQSGKDLSWLAPDKTLAVSSPPIPAAPAPIPGILGVIPGTPAPLPGILGVIPAAAAPLPDILGAIPGAPAPIPAGTITRSDDGRTLTITGRSPEHLTQIEKIVRSNVPRNAISASNDRFVVRIPDPKELQTVADIIADIDEVDVLYESIENASQVPVYMFGPLGLQAEPSFSEDIVIELPARFHLDAGHLYALDVSGVPELSIQHVAIKVHDLSKKALEYFKAHELPVLLSIADLKRVRAGQQMSKQFYLVEAAGELRLETHPIGHRPSDLESDGELVAELRMGNRKPRTSKAFPSLRSQSRPTNFETSDSVLFVEMIVTEPGNDGDAEQSQSAIYMDGTVVGNDGLVAIVMDKLVDNDGKLQAQIESITLKTYRGEVIHGAKYVIHDPSSGLALLQSSQIPVPALRLDGPTVVDSQGVAIFGRANRDPLGVTVFQKDGWSMDSQVSVPIRAPFRDRFLVSVAEGLSGSAITLTTTGHLVGILTRRTATSGQTGLSKTGTVALPVALIDDLVRKYRDDRYSQR